MKIERTYQGFSYNTYSVTFESDEERNLTDDQLIKKIDSMNYFGGTVGRNADNSRAEVRVYTD